MRNMKNEKYWNKTGTPDTSYLARKISYPDMGMQALAGEFKLLLTSSSEPEIMTQKIDRKIAL